MRVKFSTCLYSLLLLTGATAALGATGVANATWSAGPKGQGPVGFGIYEKEGSCEDLRSAQPLRIGTKNLKAGASSGPLQVKELDFCVLFVADPTTAKPDGVTSNCASGSIDFSYDAQAKEYLGKYDITMKNKAVRRGEFRAQLCEHKESTRK